MRICITGGPRTGKTTLSRRMGSALVRHTDDLIGKLDWSGASREVARWFGHPGPWIIEGVAVPRALRKWLAAHQGKPCDRVIVLTKAYTALDPGQATMAKGVNTVWREIQPILRARGVVVEVR